MKILKSEKRGSFITRMTAFLLAAGLVFSALPFLPECGKSLAENGSGDRSAVLFYTALRDRVAPGIGVVSGEALPVRAYKLAEDMIRGASGLVCAAVCDLNGDGENEMLAVTAGESAAERRGYAYSLHLYGVSPETGTAEEWDMAENAAMAETGTGSGYMSVHLQRSEGAVYIICDASIENYTSSEWDYRTSRIYRVEDRKIVDITDYEGFIRGNSGVSLHRTDDSRTMLCCTELQWQECRTTDCTRLAEYLEDPASAGLYQPAEINLEQYAGEQGIERAPADRLVSEIENEVCAVIHLSTSEAENGRTQYIYDTALNCRLSVTARDADGAIETVMISDSALYDKSRYLFHISEYLDTDMSGELKQLYGCVLRSGALGLSEEERSLLSAAELIGNEKSNLDQIVFYNRRSETAGRVTLEIEKAVYTAAAGSNASFVRLTMSGPEETQGSEPEEIPGPQAEEIPGPEPAEEIQPAEIQTAPQPEFGTFEEDLAEELVFSAGSFKRGQTYAVYAAPSAKAWRGAKGKAKVSTNGTVWTAGYDGKWLLIMYETSGGSVRVGYIDSGKIKGELPEARTLTLNPIPAVMTAAAEMTDDPQRSASVIKKLKQGAEVTLLAQWNGWAYIETKADKKTARGFVPLDSLERMD